MPRRAALALVLAALAACNDKPKDAPAPVATAEHAEHASSAAPSATAVAAPKETATAPAAPTALVSADAAPSSAPSSAATATAKVASSDDKVVPQKTTRTDASKSTDVPKTANGVLTVAAADKILAAGQKPTVKLLDAGAEPRTELVYALEKDKKQALEFGMEMTMAIAAAGQKLPEMHVPKMTMLLDIVQGDRDASGDWKTNAKLAKVGLSPKGDQEEQIAKQMGTQVDSLKGLAMSYFVSKKGQVRDVKIDLPPGFPPDAQQMLAGLNQSFESMVAPLPNEAVGTGGKWQVVTRIQAGGADILQFATYTLKSRAGDTAALDVALVQLAANDAINAPGMPAGAKARLSSFNSSGSGTTTVDLASVAPSAGNMAMKTSMELATEMGGKKDTSSVTTNMKVTFTRPKS